jgi:hypothetical protein
MRKVKYNYIFANEESEFRLRPDFLEKLSKRTKGALSPSSRRFQIQIHGTLSFPSTMPLTSKPSAAKKSNHGWTTGTKKLFSAGGTRQEWKYGKDGEG